MVSSSAYSRLSTDNSRLSDTREILVAIYNDIQDGLKSET